MSSLEIVSRRQRTQRHAAALESGSAMAGESIAVSALVWLCLPDRLQDLEFSNLEICWTFFESSVDNRERL